MPEHQNIEYKENWRDEYLKWVCGFANANGGKIYIGKDDKGKVVGIKDYKKLMEDIPNKIHDMLGLIVDVNLKRKGKAYFIEIVVPSYSVPISYKGKYYYRTGSIKRELTGNSLNEFLLKKTGKTWDNACFLGGYIDAWGRGIEKIVDACKKEGLPDPVFDDSRGFRVTLYSNWFVEKSHNISKAQAAKTQPELELTEQATEQVTEQVSEQVKRLLYAISNREYSTQELMIKLNIKHRPTFLYNYLKPALERDLVEMTIPDKPKSSKQRYRLTNKGRVYLERL